MSAWAELVLGSLFAICCLWVPGYLVARGLRTQPTMAFALAPVVSICLYAVLSIVYGFFGVPCSWLTLPVAVATAGVLLVVLYGHKRPGYVFGFSGETNQPLASSGLFSKVSAVQLGMVLAVMIAVATAAVVYVGQLGTPENFIEYYDNAFHLSRIQGFANTRNFSSLRGSFYPSAWHMVGALAQVTFGFDAAVAQHVANLAFIIGAYPLGMVALMATLFPNKPRVVWLSGIFCLAVAFFPWRIMLFGPLYPNVASYCMMPMVCATFISFFSRDMGEKLPIKIAFFFMGGIALALAQPNGIFSSAVFLIPFCMYKMRTMVSEKLAGKRWVSIKSVAAALGLGLVFLALWVCCTKLPFMVDICTYERDPMFGMSQALEWAFNFSYVLWRPQWALAIATIYGAIAALTDAKHHWLVLSYVFAALLYTISASVRSTIKYYIVGYWYNDPYRLAAAAAIFAVPLIALAVDAIIDALQFYACLAGEKLGKFQRSRRIGSGLAVVFIACAMIFNYFPLEFVEWYWRCYGFDAVRFEMQEAYQDQVNCLDNDERAFLKKVKEIVGNDAVANTPYDGSAFSYATDNVQVVYSIFGLDPDDDSILLRRRLTRYTEEPDVAAAAKRLGVRYVLQLDQGVTNGSFSFRGTVNLMTYHKNEWSGFTQVTESTSGFELVLSDGDMRLYRLSEVD